MTKLDTASATLTHKRKIRLITITAQGRHPLSIIFDCHKVRIITRIHPYLRLILSGWIGQGKSSDAGIGSVEPTYSEDRDRLIFFRFVPQHIHRAVRVTGFTPHPG